MRVAEVLSDLVSLRVCDHADAMNLVTQHTQSSKQISSGSSTLQTSDQDTGQKPALSRSLSGLAGEEASASPDLQRALDLVDLHYGVKERYVRQGGNQGLEKARADVERVLKEIK